MGKIRGFTLIELLTVLAIAAVLVSLAAPSMSRLLRSNNMTSAVNTFLSDARFARSEAIRRGGNVVMCRSDAPEAATPTCGTGSGADGNGWVSGWIIFHDLNANGTKNTGEPVLRVQAPLTAINSVGDGGTSPKLKFTATGRLQNLSSAAQFQFGSNPPFTSDLQRVLCVNVGGRARIAGDGNAACGSDN